MVGRIQYKRERGRSQPRSESVCGLTVLTVDLCEPEGLGQKKLDRRIRKLEQTFRGAEISRVIVPNSFPYCEQLTLVRPVDPMPFYRAAADLLVLDLLRQKGIPPGVAKAALAGPRICPELCAAAERLCRTVRKLRIDVPGEEGADFSRYLQYEFGVPVVPRTAAVDAVVAFGETGEEADLCLWGKSEVCLRVEGVELPEEIEQSVLALLWEQGRVKREQIRVTNLP